MKSTARALIASLTGAASSSAQQTCPKPAILYPFLDEPILFDKLSKRSPASTAAMPIWQERAFILYPDLLLYAENFEAASVASPCGMIPLESIILVSRLPKEPRRVDFIVRSSTATTTFSLAASSEEQATRWFLALRDATHSGHSGEVNESTTRFYQNGEKFWRVTSDLALRRVTLKSQLHWELHVQSLLSLDPSTSSAALAAQVLASCTTTNPFIHTPLKYGVLKKKSPRLDAALQERFFVLYPSILVYSENREGAMLGCIPLVSVHKAARKVCAEQRDHCFLELLVSEGNKSGEIVSRVYELKALDTLERDQWLDAIAVQLNLVARASQRKSQSQVQPVEQQPRAAALTVAAEDDTEQEEEEEVEGVSRDEREGFPAFSIPVVPSEVAQDLPPSRPPKPQFAAPKPPAVDSSANPALLSALFYAQVAAQTVCECRIRYDVVIDSITLVCAESSDQQPMKESSVPLAELATASLVARSPQLDHVKVNTAGQVLDSTSLVLEWRDGSQLILYTVSASLIVKFHGELQTLLQARRSSLPADVACVPPPPQLMQYNQSALLTAAEAPPAPAPDVPIAPPMDDFVKAPPLPPKTWKTSNTSAQAFGSSSAVQQKFNSLQQKTARPVPTRYQIGESKRGSLEAASFDI